MGRRCFIALSWLVGIPAVSSISTAYFYGQFIGYSLDTIRLLLAIGLGSLAGSVCGTLATLVACFYMDDEE